jgi:hypothetical protein
MSCKTSFISRKKSIKNLEVFDFQKSNYANFVLIKIRSLSSVGKFALTLKGSFIVVVFVLLYGSIQKKRKKKVKTLRTNLIDNKEPKNFFSFFCEKENFHFLSAENFFKWRASCHEKVEKQHLIN